MGHRSFTDASGKQWNVWDVIPQWTERRSGEERRRGDDDPDVDPPVLERRRTDRRTDRRTESHEGSRIRIAAGLSRGWLAFESDQDKRRLAPIPPGWESLTDLELAALCEKAHQAPPKRRLIE
jgi:hypothetical protein